MAGRVKARTWDRIRNNFSQSDILFKCLEFVVAACSLFFFADTIAATQISSVLAPVKPEVNEIVDFFIIMVGIGGVCYGLAQGFKGQWLQAAITGLVIPGIAGAILIASKF